MFRLCSGTTSQLFSARHIITLAWKSKSCSEYVCYQIKHSTVLCQCPLWPKTLMSFWIASSAGGATAQQSAFVHVEISHPVALECILPREANIFSFFYTAQFLLSVLWFVPFSVVPDLSQTQTRSSRHSTWSNHCLSLSSWKSSIEQNWFFLACGIFFSVFPFICIIHLPFGFCLSSHCL